jgi:ABC-2 type transport system ATP-binding protein
MLKAGRIVAMEPTRDLLARISGLQLALKLRGPLPVQLAGQVIERAGDRTVLKVAQPADVEAVLAACRSAGCSIEDIEVGHADLEDVFLQVMSDAGQRRAA